MQTIEQVAELYKKSIAEVKVAEEKAAKYKTILEEMRSQVEAALGIAKKPVYRSDTSKLFDGSIGGDGRI